MHPDLTHPRASRHKLPLPIKRNRVRKTIAIQINPRLNRVPQISAPHDDPASPLVVDRDGAQINALQVGLNERARAVFSKGFIARQEAMHGIGRNTS